MKKKLISMLLLSTLVLSMTGCSSSGKTADKPATEPVDVNMEEVSNDATITMLYSDNATYPYKEDWLVWDIFKEYAGVTIDPQVVPESDFDTKRQMVIQSGDVPDILTKTGSQSAGIINPAQSLLAISDYIDKMPNFKAYIDESGLMADLDRARESDGKFYFVPVKTGNRKDQYHQWMIRTDLLEEFGLEVPKTLDDIYEVAKVFKEHYPNSTPISNRFGSGNIMAGIMSGYDTIGGWTIGAGMEYREDEDKWRFAATTDNFRDALEYAHKLHEEGLLDPEYATMDSTVYEQKVVQGDTFIMYAWVGNQRIWNAQGTAIDEDFKVETIMPPTGPTGEVAIEPMAGWEQTWALPKSLEKDPKHLAEVLKFVDWCFTDEAAMLLTIGVEGKTSKKHGDGYIYLDPEVNYTSTEGLWNNALNVRLYARPPITDDEIIDEESLAAIAELNVVKPLPPNSPLSAEQKEANSVMTSTLITFINTQMESFISGQLSLDSDWEQFKADCADKGSDDLTKQYNEAWTPR